MAAIFSFECFKCHHEFEAMHDRNTIVKARINCPSCGAKKKCRRIYKAVQIIDDTLKEPLHLVTLKACLPHNVAANRPYDICTSRSEIRRAVALHPKIHGGREIESLNGV